MKTGKAKRYVALAMVIFGTIGLFRRNISLPSGGIAAARGLVGMLFLLGVMGLKKQRIDLPAIRKRWRMLLISGTALGVNWMLLFEAYQHTTVATATLCYYMAPVLVMLLSPLLLWEKLSTLKAVCIAVSLVGMIFVSGILDAGFSGSGEWLGVLLGLGAAAFYATVMLCNKQLADVPSTDRTNVQLGVAGLVLLPYNLLTSSPASAPLTLASLGVLAVVCILHTGVAYVLYFGAMPSLPAQTVALYSYIDPLVAILCSALLLHESLTPLGWLGAAMILGATLLSELLPEKRASTSNETSA